MAEAKELNPADIPPEFDSAIYTRAFNTAAAGGEHPFGNPFEAGNAAASWDAGFAAGWDRLAGDSEYRKLFIRSENDG